MNHAPDLDDNDRPGSEGAANLGSGGGGENDAATGATAPRWVDATRETSLHHANDNHDEADCGSIRTFE